MYHLEILNLNKKFRDIVACDNININIEKGEIVCLLGESGCGKSTFLKILAGFEIANSGDIFLNERQILSDKIFVKSENRNIAILFQEHSLFPHLTVRENIELALKNKDNAKVNELMQISEITELENRYPHEISGGQQQRVALVRTLLQNPDLILLDEPFSNLDENTKTNLRTYFRKVLKKSNLTTILVTHDTEDAANLADRVLVMQNGRIIEDSNFKDIYSTPNSPYIGKLFKNINILKPDRFGIEHSGFIGVYPNSIILNEGKYKGTTLLCTPFYDKYNLLIEYKDQLFFTLIYDFIEPETEINFKFDMDRIIYY